MCEPKYYNVSYEINPWMNKKISVDNQKAYTQWKHLKDTLQSCNINVLLIPPVDGLPDMVFTANAALMIDGKAYLSEFRYNERKNEAGYNKLWFEHHDIPVDQYALDNNCCFEGEGDALFAGPVQLFAGYGFRSDQAYFPHLQHVLDKEIIYCEMINPYFYHLDTCFCPLDANSALWWPDAFSKATQSFIRNTLDVIDVPEEDAKRFCCNAVVAGKNIIIPSHCDKTKKELERRGFTVFCCDMDEYIKAGGACKCLTLILES
jgi:N-dimethylarginine dimethylaminohydrolase